MPKLVFVDFYFSIFYYYFHLYDSMHIYFTAANGTTAEQYKSRIVLAVYSTYHRVMESALSLMGVVMLKVVSVLFSLLVLSLNVSFCGPQASFISRMRPTILSSESMTWCEYSKTSFIVLNTETYKIYAVQITRYNQPEWANFREHDIPFLITMNKRAAPSYDKRK